MRVLFLMAVGVLGACATPSVASPAPEPIDPYVLRIEVGRWGAMAGRVRELAFDENRPAPTVEEDYNAPNVIARDLRITVWDYNSLKASLCAEGRHTALTCTPALTPAWLAEPVNAQPSLDELQARSNMVGDAVMPLWDALCDEAKAKVPEDEQMAVCPME